MKLSTYLPTSCLPYRNIQYLRIVLALTDFHRGTPLASFPPTELLYHFSRKALNRHHRIALGSVRWRKKKRMAVQCHKGIVLSLLKMSSYYVNFNVRVVSTWNNLTKYKMGQIIFLANYPTFCSKLILRLIMSPCLGITHSWWIWLAFILSCLLRDPHL